MSETATAPATAPTPAESDADRTARIELWWGQYRADFAEQVETNQLDMLPAKKVSDEISFLVEQARESGHASGKVLERLRNVAAEWREYRVSNMKDINADRRVPMGCGKVCRTVEFLIAVAKGETPPDEPAAVREPAGPATPARDGGVVVGARWTGGN